MSENLSQRLLPAVRLRPVLKSSSFYEDAALRVFSGLFSHEAASISTPAGRAFQPGVSCLRGAAASSDHASLVITGEGISDRER